MTPVVWCPFHACAEATPCDHARRDAEQEATIAVLTERNTELLAEVAKLDARFAEQFDRAEEERRALVLAKAQVAALGSKLDSVREERAAWIRAVGLAHASACPGTVVDAENPEGMAREIAEAVEGLHVALVEERSATERARESATAVATVSAAYIGAVLEDRMTRDGGNAALVSREMLLAAKLARVEDLPDGGVRLVLTEDRLRDVIEPLPKAQTWVPRKGA